MDQDIRIDPEADAGISLSGISEDRDNLTRPRGWNIIRCNDLSAIFQGDILAIFDLTKERSKWDARCLELVCVECPFQVLLHDPVTHTENGVVQSFRINREFIGF